VRTPKPQRSRHLIRVTRFGERAHLEHRDFDSAAVQDLVDIIGDSINPDDLFLRIHGEFHQVVHPPQIANNPEHRGTHQRNHTEVAEENLSADGKPHAASSLTGHRCAAVP